MIVFFVPKLDEDIPLVLIIKFHKSVSTHISQVVRLSGESTFLSEDLQLLESMEYKQRIKQIAEFIEEVNWENVDPDMLTRCVQPAV